MNRICLEQRAVHAAARRIGKMAGAVAVVAAAGFGALAHGQQAPGAANAGGASMVKPPQPSADGANAGANAVTNPHNPDNMPIKRPDQTTNDRMMHAPPPASAALAK